MNTSVEQSLRGAGTENKPGIKLTRRVGAMLGIAAILMAGCSAHEGDSNDVDQADFTYSSSNVGGNSQLGFRCVGTDPDTLQAILSTKRSGAVEELGTGLRQCEDGQVSTGEADDLRNLVVSQLDPGITKMDLSPLN